MNLYIQKLKILKKVIFIAFLGVLFSYCDDSKKLHTDSIDVEKYSLINSSSYDSIDFDSIEFDSIEVDSLNKLALKYCREGDFQESLKLTNLAFTRAKSENNQEVLAEILNTLGLIQWRLGNNVDAINSYSEAGKIAEQLGMLKLLGKTHTNRGIILNGEKDFEAAFFHSNQAINIFKSQNDYLYLAIAQNNQGEIFKNKKINDSAEVYYLEAIKNYSKVNYDDGIACSYYNLSDIYLREGKKNLSLSAIKKSLEHGVTIQRKLRISDAYKKLSEIYESFNQQDSALKYYKLYESEKSEILINNQSKLLAEYQAKLGSKVKNLQIENLQKEQQLANNYYWFIAFAIFSIILLAGFFVYRHFQKMHFNKINLESQLSNSKKILTIKEQELLNSILDLSKKNEIIHLLQKEIRSNSIDENDDITHLLEQKILTEEDWEVFKNRFNGIYPNFLGKVQHYKSQLTEGEIRYLVLLHLHLNSSEMGKILGVSSQSVRVCKMRLKKKLKMEGYDNVESFLKTAIQVNPLVF